MNFITNRAVNLAKYLIKNGLSPNEAIYISINKYIHNPKLDIKKMISKIKRELKHEFYFEEEDF